MKFGGKLNYVGVPGCGGLLTNNRGSLSSPNHPDTYEHNLDCEWLIRASPDERIELTFHTLSLERSRNCRFDYIEVSFIMTFIIQNVASMFFCITFILTLINLNLI